MPGLQRESLFYKTGVPTGVPAVERMFLLTAPRLLRTLEAMTTQEIQKILDELQVSRASRRRAWENLQEIRRVLKATTLSIFRPRNEKRSFWRDGVVKDGVRDHQSALTTIGGVPDR
jgi:hypothetical protein